MQLPLPLRLFLALLLAATASFLLWHALAQPSPSPKPLGHPHIILPAHEYAPLPNGFPYTFEVSQHATVVPSASPRAERYWIDLHYPAFGAVVQLTYKPVKNSPALLRAYCLDAYRLTAKHQVRATAMQEHSFRTGQGDLVLMTVLSGLVPSQVQFYTTDQQQHFLRGALYFDTATRNDYLAPIIAFIKEDILHMLHTLQWQHRP